MKINRRSLLGTASAGILAGKTGFSAQSSGDRSPISVENQKPGTTDWQLTYVFSQNYRSSRIEGYCSKASVSSGETIDIFTSTDVPTQLVIDIYRMGYYQGKGGRHMTRLGPFSVGPQKEAPFGERRLRQCQWESTVSLAIPDDWLSGVYLGKLSCEAHRYQSYVIFIVRDRRPVDLLFQCSDTTWQAYNKWPDEFSLYDSDPPEQPLSSRTWVSFDRPYGKYPQVVDNPLSQGSGEFLLWEFPLCFWLERHGYDVSYGSNLDTHRDPDRLKNTRCLLSVGHDEYWTLEMFNNLKAAVREGLSIGFLSANTAMWMIELLPSFAVSHEGVDELTGLTTEGDRIPIPDELDGAPDRIFWRAGRFGGLTEDEIATGYMGPFPRKGPNENTLIGARTVYPFNGSADWIATRADHWIFEGTGMQNGDRIPGLVGWEFHGDPADLPGLEVIAAGTPINSGDRESSYTATVYPGPKNNWVFNAATIFWPIGLSDPPGLVPPFSHRGRPHGQDDRVQRITSNFLEKCGIAPHPREG